MADLGNIGRLVSKRPVKTLPYWAVSGNRTILTILTDKIYIGATKEKISGTDYDSPYQMVMLFYIPNGLLIARKRSDATAQFRFENLTTDDTNNYLIIGLCQDSCSQVYNAIPVIKSVPVAYF